VALARSAWRRARRLLLEHGLLDGCALWVPPLILDRGGPRDLLLGAAPAVGDELADAITLSDGIVILRHHPGKALPRERVDPEPLPCPR
jgi:hypothetical protein